MVGERRGYLIRVGFSGDYSEFLTILIRFPTLHETPKALKQRLTQAPEWSTLKKGVALETAPSSLVCRYSSAWGTPKAQIVRERVDRWLDVLPRFAPPFAGRCEECQGSGAQHVTAEIGRAHV